MLVENRNVIFVVVYLLVQTSFAGTIGLDYTQSSSSKTNGANISGDFDQDANSQNQTPQDQFTWGLDFSQSRQQTTDATTGAAVSESTYTSSASLGWDTPAQWTWGIDYSYSATPDENLTSKGPRGSVDYTFIFKSPKTKKTVISDDLTLDADLPNAVDDSYDEFAPELTFGVSYGTTEYADAYSANKIVVSGRLRNRTTTTVPVNGTAVITQKDVSPSVSWTYWEPITLSASYTKYSYDKDPAEFSANLNQFPAAARTVNGLSQALSGFSSDSTTGTLDWALSNFFRISLKRSLSHSASYDESTVGNSLGFEIRLKKKFKIKLSGETDATKSTTATTSSNIYSFGVSYYNW